MLTVLDQLQRDLRRDLLFYVVGEFENMNRPGDPIRVHDVIRFSIDARNNSPVTMMNITSVFTCTRAIDFIDETGAVIGKNLPGLVIDTLSPGQSKNVLVHATAKVQKKPSIFETTYEEYLNRGLIGNISASGTADLSALPFTDLEKFSTEINIA